MSLEVVTNRTADLFAKCFGHAPGWIAAAPGRVNLIGEHTDYNEGYVLPMAVDRYTVIAGDRRTGKEVTLHSVTTGETAEFSMKPEVIRGNPPWSNYVRGVLAGFCRLPARVPGCEMVIDSEVPYGGGLASSAALEVATATFLEEATGKRLDPVEKALLCQHAEHEFAGVPCGIMDQFTSVMARKDHALLLDCRSREIRLVPMQDPSVTVMIINTNVRHKLADSEYAKRRFECELAAKALKVGTLRDATLDQLEAAEKSLAPVSYHRALHVITENTRVLLMAEAIARADWIEAGNLMYASHTSLRDDYQVSCAELDAVVEIARGLGVQQGVYGCRMTGAGFGGCTVALIKTELVKSVTRKIEELYENRTRNQAAIFSTRPGGGARLVR